MRWPLLAALLERDGRWDAYYLATTHTVVFALAETVVLGDEAAMLEATPAVCHELAGPLTQLARLGLRVWVELHVRDDGVTAEVVEAPRQ